MKIFLLISVLTFTSLSLFGQERVRTGARYHNIAKPGIFFMRWYSVITGGPRYLWKQTLVLKSDGSFEYSYSGGECGTFDHGGTGKWKKDGNELTLEVSDDLFLLSKRYTIDKRRLVPSDDPSRDGAFRMTGGDARPLGQ